MGPGTVKIVGELKARELRITISDNGVGIPRHILPMILNPGYGSGNGVGLSNVNERFKSLYGENYGLLIQSREGTGTWITLRIPIYHTNAKSSAASAFRMRAFPGNSSSKALVNIPIPGFKRTKRTSENTGQLSRYSITVVSAILAARSRGKR